MDKIEEDELKRLLKLLEPELIDFKNLIKDMASIDSPYKHEFSFMRTMVNNEKFKLTLEGQIGLVIEELNQFAALYAKIIEDDDISELYVESGLLDKSLTLQQQIMSKLGIS